jgi:hypothetical protein
MGLGYQGVVVLNRLGDYDEDFSHNSVQNERHWDYIEIGNT